MAGDTGVLLNNRMTYWHLDAEHPDCLAPGKRVRHTMNTCMVFDAPAPGQEGPGALLVVLGTPGADTQVQTNLQMATGVLDFGLNAVEAVEAPRWRHLQNPTESTVPHTCEDALNLETRFSAEAQDGLRRRGHPVHQIGPWAGYRQRDADPARSRHRGPPRRRGPPPRRQRYRVVRT